MRTLVWSAQGEVVNSQWGFFSGSSSQVWLLVCRPEIKFGYLSLEPGEMMSFCLGTQSQAAGDFLAKTKLHRVRVKKKREILIEPQLRSNLHTITASRHCAESTNTHFFTLLVPLSPFFINIPGVREKKSGKTGWNVEWKWINWRQSVRFLCFKFS